MSKQYGKTDATTVSRKVKSKACSQVYSSRGMHCNALMDACIATLFNIQLHSADRGRMLQTATELQSHQQLRVTRNRVS